MRDEPKHTRSYAIKTHFSSLGRVTMLLIALAILWPMQKAEGAVVRYCTATGEVVMVDAGTLAQAVTYYDCTTRAAVVVYPARPAYVAHPVGVGPASVRGVSRRTSRRTTRRMYHRHR